MGRKENEIMKTAIDGKVRLKLFWGCEYSGRGITPIERIYKIGKLILAKVVYSEISPFYQDYYKKDVMKMLNELYDVRLEKTPDGTNKWYIVYSVVDGGYVGTPEDAYRFFQQGLLSIQKADVEDNVCSIGFNPAKQKWYGWSHRARYGFGVGDIVSKGDCCASSGWTPEYLKEHPEKDTSLPVGFEAKTLDDAKRMAIAFAESVS